MSDSDFITIYDAASIGYRYWWFPAGGLIFLAVGLIMPKLFEAGIFPDYQKRMFADSLPIMFVFFSILWTLGAFFTTFGAYWNGRETLLSGKAQYVEGVVQDFVPMPHGGHANESFDVNGVSFSYSDFIVGGGFNTTSSYGGPIREGLFVRIWYSGNDILKLQVLKGSRPAK